MPGPHSAQAPIGDGQDAHRDYFMTAEEAKAWALIDDILVPRRGVSAPKVAVAS